jgi:tetratricopeptide (TPR) repeat protein
MQTAAMTSRFLTGCSSKVGLTDSEILVSRGALLRDIVTRRLAQTVHSQKLFVKLTNELIQIAEQALVMRDLHALEEVGEVLMSLPVDAAQQVGLYYHAFAINRNRRDEAESLLQTVADNGPITYRARAIQTLGGIHHLSGQLDEALRFQLEALRAASDRNAHGLQTRLMAGFEVSIIKSLDGDHKGALSGLRSLGPLVNLIAREKPFYFYLHCSELAIELGELGHLAEAQATLEVALASPYAPAYPNWTETRQELEAKRTSATPSVVAINRAPEPSPQEAEPSPRAEPRLKPYKSRSRLCAWLATENSFLQRPSIAITLIATIDVDQITPGILDRVLVCIRSRAPPDHR